MKKLHLLSLFLLFFLSACSKQVSPTIEGLSPEEAQENETYVDSAEDRWNAMLINIPNAYPFLMEGSLRVGDEDRTQRVNYLLWGNPHKPYRLDLTVASRNAFQAYQDENGVILYIPSKNIAYHYNELKSALDVMQIELPFGLTEVIAFAQGRTAYGLRNLSYTTATYNEENNSYTYVIPFSQKENNALYGTWVIDEFARPILWVGSEWTITFEYEKNKTNKDTGETIITQKPNKISGASIDSKVFILFIRENELKSLYDKSELKLELPHDVRAVY